VTLAFLDNTAVMEGHTLVIPKRHAADLLEIDVSEAAAMMRTAHRMALWINEVFGPDGVTLFQANREAGWQDVFHIHLHVVPRLTGDHLHRPWTAQVRADPRRLAAVRARMEQRSAT
jgi:histidine triad (HIT) family protein